MAHVSRKAVWAYVTVFREVLGLPEKGCGGVFSNLFARGALCAARLTARIQQNRSSPADVRDADQRALPAPGYSGRRLGSEGTLKITCPSASL